MPGPLASYTPEVMENDCPRCKRKKYQRCLGPFGLSKTIPAHGARLALVGLRWDNKTQTLMKKES